MSVGEDAYRIPGSAGILASAGKDAGAPRHRGQALASVPLPERRNWPKEPLGPDFKGHNRVQLANKVASAGQMLGDSLSDGFQLE